MTLMTLMTLPRNLCLAALVAAGGCGDRLVDGRYLGDAALRLRATLPTVSANVERPLVGVVWLGYEALIRRSGASISAARVSPALPPYFTFDVIGEPPSVGVYLDSDGTPIDADLRLARLIFVDDADGDATFVLDENLAVRAPDRLVAEAERHLLLYFARRELGGEPVGLLDDWSAVRVGANLIERDPAVASPALRARVVDDATTVVFDLPSGAVTE